MALYAFDGAWNVDEENRLFRIGAGGDNTIHTAARETELFTFANDLNSRYGNNTGKVRVTVTRVV